MKTGLIYIVVASLIGLSAATAAAAPEVDFNSGSRRFETAGSSDAAEGELVMTGGKLTVDNVRKNVYLREKQRHMISVSGGMVKAGFKVEGKGRAAVVIYLFDADGKQIGRQTGWGGALADGKSRRLIGAARISPEHTQGREVKSVAFGFYVNKGAELTFSDGRAWYENDRENPSLTPRETKAGLKKLSEKLTASAKKFHQRGERPKIMFLGDSITYGWSLDPAGKVPGGLEVWNRKLAPLGAVNFGVPSDRIQHLRWRITAGEQLICQPEIVVLMIGTNNIGTSPDRVADVAAGIDNLISVIKNKVPDVKILLLALTPRGKAAPTGAVNQLLPAVAAKHGAVFIDPGPVLTDGTGLADDRSIFRDGLHLSPRGYELFSSVLLPEITKLTATKNNAVHVINNNSEIQKGGL